MIPPPQQQRPMIPRLPLIRPMPEPKYPWWARWALVAALILLGGPIVLLLVAYVIHAAMGILHTVWQSPEWFDFRGSSEIVRLGVLCVVLITIVGLAKVLTRRR